MNRAESFDLQQIETLINQADKNVLNATLKNIEAELLVIDIDKKVDPSELIILTADLAAATPPAQSCVDLTAAILNQLRAQGTTAEDRMNYIFHIRKLIKDQIAVVGKLPVIDLKIQKGNEERAVDISLEGLGLHHYFAERAMLDDALATARHEVAKKLNIPVAQVTDEEINREANLADAKQHFRSLLAVPATKLVSAYKLHEESLITRYPKLGEKTQTLQDVAKRLDNLSDEQRDVLLQTLGGLVITGATLTANEAIKAAKRKFSDLYSRSSSTDEQELTPQERKSLKKTAARVEQLKADPLFADDPGFIDEVSAALRQSADMDEYVLLGPDIYEQFNDWKTLLLNTYQIQHNTWQYPFNWFFTRYFQPDGDLIDTLLPKKGDLRGIMAAHDTADDAIRILTTALLEAKHVDYPELNDVQEDRLYKVQSKYVDGELQPMVMLFKAKIEPKPHPDDLAAAQAGNGNPPNKPPEDPPKNPVDPKDPKKEPESGKEYTNEEIAGLIYEVIRDQHNPNMPPFADLKPEIATQVLEQLTLGITKMFSKIFNVTTASGGNKLYQPNAEAKLWDDVIPVSGSIPDDSKTLGFLFNNFPWEKLSKKPLTHEQLESWILLKQMQIVHVAQMHNFSKRFEGIRSQELKPDYPDKVIGLHGELGNGAGYMAADMDQFYTSDLRRHLPEFAAVFGETDRIWAYVHQTTDFFMQKIKIHNSALTTSSFAKPLDLLEKQRPIFIREIPSSARIPGIDQNYMDLLTELGWYMAVWTIYPNHMIFDGDVDGLGSKFGRDLNKWYYLFKSFIGSTNTDERWLDDTMLLRKTNIARADYIHMLANIEEKKHYDVLSVKDVEREIAELAGKADQNSKDRHKALKDFLRELKVHATLQGEKLTHVQAINKRYKIIRMKQEYRNLKYEWSLPVAVPLSFFKIYRKDGALRSEVMLSERQVIMSGLNRNYIEHSTVTPDNQTRWVKLQGEMSLWNKAVDATVKDGVFPDIHNLSHKIRKKMHFIQLPTNLKFALKTAIGERIHYTDKLAFEMDEFLRNQVNIVPRIEPSELADKSGMGFTFVTKTAGRYAWGDYFLGGSRFPGEDPIATAEIALDMYRSDWAGDSNFKDLRQLLEQTKRQPNEDLREKAKAEARRRAVTTVPPGLRMAADHFYEGKPKKAENEFVVESFWVAVCLYLRRYQYSEVLEGGHNHLEVHEDTEMLMGQIHTVSGMKPMDFAHRKLFLSFCNRQFEIFKYDADFGNGNPDTMPENALSVGDVYKKMIELGIIGTPQQFVVDKHYYNGEFQKVSTGSTHDDKKGGH